MVDEKADGTCRVRWSDPYEKKTREAQYHCDAGRDDILKAPNYSDSRGYGWESGFMFTEGPDRGDLYDFEASSEEQDFTTSDTLLLLGVLLILIGLVGGNLRALPRVLGVEARLVRRATRLAEAAVWAAEDYARAVDAVRDAGRHGSLDAAPDPELVRSLWVLREAGPQTRRAAADAQDLVNRMRPLLEEAAPPPGCGTGSKPGRPPAPTPRRRSPSCADCWPTPNGTACGSGSRRHRSTCSGGRTPTGPPSQPGRTSSGTLTPTDGSWRDSRLARPRPGRSLSGAAVGAADRPARNWSRTDGTRATGSAGTRATLTPCARVPGLPTPPAEAHDALGLRQGEARAIGWPGCRRRPAQARPTRW
ncbi:hypothetical protein [Streptomyces sp. NPDC058891]|uniref:hypothetical protein n=1 Tax=Streptomyces sp. NPDC058891 TaxID=3346667 RepID=UPI0036C2E73E